MQIRAAEIVPAPAALHPTQLRAARAMLDWTLMEASRRSRISVAAINSLETGTPRVDQQVYSRQLRAAFEAAGIVFSDVSIVSLGVGVCLKTPFSDK